VNAILDAASDFALLHTRAFGQSVHAGGSSNSSAFDAPQEALERLNIIFTTSKRAFE
jgi:hypothetical protein